MQYFYVPKLRENICHQVLFNSAMFTAVNSTAQISQLSLRWEIRWMNCLEFTLHMLFLYLLLLCRRYFFLSLFLSNKNHAFLSRSNKLCCVMYRRSYVKHRWVSIEMFLSFSAMYVRKPLEKKIFHCLFFMFMQRQNYKNMVFQITLSLHCSNNFNSRDINEIILL